MCQVTKRKRTVDAKVDDIKVIAHSIRGGHSIPKDLCDDIFDGIRTDPGANGVICKCMGIKTLKDFCAFLNSPNNVFFFGLLGESLMTMAWVDFIDGRNGRVHFVTFRHSYGGINITSGLATVRYIFNTGMFDSLIGYTPTDNKLALSFNRKVGFVEIGVAPLSHYDDVKRISKDAMVTYCTKERISEVIREYTNNED